MLKAALASRRSDMVLTATLLTLHFQLHGDSQLCSQASRAKEKKKKLAQHIGKQELLQCLEIKLLIHCKNRGGRGHHRPPVC